MSYLPYMFDIEVDHVPKQYVMSFLPENIFEAIDTSSFEYFPMPTKESNVRKERKDRFEIYVDVEGYDPDDISVKTVDGFIVVEGKHKEKKDELGWEQRQFSRRCPLPKGYKTKAFLSQYSFDGTLTITAVLVKNNETSCDIPVNKKEGDKKPDEKPDQAKPTEKTDGEESEKKPVKSKTVEKEKEKKEVERKADGEKPSQPIAEEGLAQAKPESKDEPTSETTEQQE